MIRPDLVGCKKRWRGCGKGGKEKGWRIRLNPRQDQRNGKKERIKSRFLHCSLRPHRNGREPSVACLPHAVLLVLHCEHDVSCFPSRLRSRRVTECTRLPPLHSSDGGSGGESARDNRENSSRLSPRRFPQDLIRVDALPLRRKRRRLAGEHWDKDFCNSDKRGESEEMPTFPLPPHPSPPPPQGTPPGSEAPITCWFYVLL